MAAGNFEHCVNVILGYEGGLSNHPADPGGLTKYGISKTFHPDVDVENLTLEQAKQIYKDEYWDAAGCEDLPEPLDFAVFDASVQHGSYTAKQMLKNAAGMWENMIIQRMERYVRWSKINKAARDNFFFGWMCRLAEVVALCRTKDTLGDIKEA